MTMMKIDSLHTRCFRENKTAVTLLNSQGTAFRQKALSYPFKCWGCCFLIPSLLPFPSWLQFKELRRQRLEYIFSATTLCLLWKFHLSKVSSTKHNDLLLNKSISKVSSTILPALFIRTCIAGSVIDIFYCQLQVMNGLDWVNLWAHLKEGVWIDNWCRRVSLLWRALSLGRWSLASEQRLPWFFLLEFLPWFHFLISGIWPRNVSTLSTFQADFAQCFYSSNRKQTRLGRGDGVLVEKNKHCAMKEQFITDWVPSE